MAGAAEGTGDGGDGIGVSTCCDEFGDGFAELPVVPQSSQEDGGNGLVDVARDSFLGRGSEVSEEGCDRLASPCMGGDLFEKAAPFAIGGDLGGGLNDLVLGGALGGVEKKSGEFSDRQ